MDKTQSTSKLTTPQCEVEDYYSSDSSSPSLKQAASTSCTNFCIFTFVKEMAAMNATVIMPVMAIATNNLEEEMAAMNAMLERLAKENKEKVVCIKLHEEKIARLTRKLEKRPARSLVKSSESEEEERASIPREASDEEV